MEAPLTTDVEGGDLNVAAVEAGPLAGADATPDKLPGTEDSVFKELSVEDHETDPITRLLEKTGANKAGAQLESWLGQQIHAIAAVLRRLWAESPPFKYGTMAAGALLAVLVLVLHFLGDLRRMLALTGMCSMLAALAMTSSDRSAIEWERAVSSLSLQVIMGLLIVYTPFRLVFQSLGDAVTILLSYAAEGGDFVFASYDSLGKQTPVAHVLPTSANFSLVTSVDFASKQFSNGTVTMPVAGIEVCSPAGSNLIARRLFAQMHMVGGVFLFFCLE